MKRTVSAILLVILLTSLLCSVFKIMPVGAVGTIYIRADGSIDPPTANITTSDSETYFFTDDNHDTIMVERSNIIIDGMGYALQGLGSGNGFNLTGLNNVTIKNVWISKFLQGILITESLDCTISENNITENQHGISSYCCNSSRVLWNNITSNTYYGLYLQASQKNTISYNNISKQIQYNIYASSSCNDNIFSNNIISSGSYGLYAYCSNSTVSDNNITKNTSDGVSLYGFNNMICRNIITEN